MLKKKRYKLIFPTKKIYFFIRMWIDRLIQQQTHVEIITIYMIQTLKSDKSKHLAAGNYSGDISRDVY